MLREYQVQNASKLEEIIKKKGLAYFAAAPRTGKTLTSMEVANLLGVKRVLFVTKKKAIPSIEGDYEKFAPQWAITIINYESLHKVESSFDLVIVDEAHSFGSYPKPSNRFKLLKEIIGDAKVLLLSGTPTPESYSQIYHQLNLSVYSPYKEYKTFYKWAKDFIAIELVQRGQYMTKDYSKAKEEIIKKDIKEIMLTFTQEEAGFKTDVQEKVFNMAQDTVIEKLMSDLDKKKVVCMPEGDIVADTAAKLLSKLHQLSGGTIKFEDGTTKIISYEKAKAIKLMTKGKKIAIFYKFKAELELLKDIFTNFVLTPEEFNKSDNVVFLGQFQSAREGVNLSTADILIFYNLDFSAVSYWQSRERLSHFDRVEPILLYWFISNKIDKYVHKALTSKHDFTLQWFRRNTQ